MNFHNKVFLVSLALLPVLSNCQSKHSKVSDPTNAVAEVKLPDPYATKSVSNYSDVIGWKDGAKPLAPPGFDVNLYAEDFENPRWMYVLPNGDVLVAESNSNYSIAKQVGATIIGAGGSNDLSNSADRITLLRDEDGNGKKVNRKIVLTHENGLNQPFGMLLIDDWLYVANTDALIKFPFNPKTNTVIPEPIKVVDLPAGKHNRHWTRNIIYNEKLQKIFIAVGSGSNAGENGMEAEVLKANILTINPDGSELKVFASGIRNPVGMGYAPGTNVLWTSVNERDELGNNLVPDYLTSVTEGGFYGWPYVYWGQHPDPRVKALNPVLVKKTIVPDVNLGSHTASLGLLFYTGNMFPKEYKNGAFIAQHGSWNRKPLSGYKVVYVPFENGKPGQMQDFLTGFIVDPEKDDVRGRPVGLAMLPDGSMLLTDDTSAKIWRISYSGP